MGKKKNKSTRKAAAAASSRGVVGPDYIQVLAGSIASKSISLVLCGESHNDAIDVTRAGGGRVKEGWIATDYVELAAEMVGQFDGIGEEEDVRVKCGTCRRHHKALSLGKAREWGRGVGNEEADYTDHGHEIALLFVPARGNEGSKGKAFVVELFLEEAADADADAEDEDRSRSHLPPEVLELLDCMSHVVNKTKGAKSLQTAVQDLKKEAENEALRHTLLVWDDLDAEARALNQRRLLGEDVSPAEHDALIRARARRRKEENLYTWDNWLADVGAKLHRSETTALHVVLESFVPPREVELCRDFLPDFDVGPAAESLRCLSEDSEESSADAYDPASDGCGAYIDFVFRRLWAVDQSMRGGDAGRGYLHCVDCRDLGHGHAVGAEDSLGEEWMRLLEPREKEAFDSGKLDLNPDPEKAKLEELRGSGQLKSEDTNFKDLGDSDTEESNMDPITLPSIEQFFGQCTDIIYYTPEVKASYFSFIGKVVKSFNNWNSFFAELFFGGTVGRALSLLDLSCTHELHVRSPLLKYWNATTGEYEWHERSNRDDYVNLPFLPIKCFLKAKGSDPVRTWTSSIFALLSECACQELRDMATHAATWALDDIARQCENPKLSDDEVGGGEWFLAYMRQCHREVYDDIDHSDPAPLVQKRYAPGESGKKHKIGDIIIPSLKLYFSEEGLTQLAEKSDKSSLREAEVMAKILIDIYMSKLVDAATVVKIAQLILEEPKENITIVCYMGVVHTRALCDFFSMHGFKKKIFCGKQDWGDEEGRIIFLPKELWNLSALHDKQTN